MNNFNNLSYAGGRGRGNASQRSGAGRYGFAGARHPPYATSHHGSGSGGQSNWTQPKFQNISRAQSSWNGWQCQQNQPVPQMNGSIRPMFSQESYCAPRWNNLPGQNQNIANHGQQKQMTAAPPSPTQLHPSKTTPSFQQQSQQPPSKHVNQCLSVPFWNGDNETGYHHGPITPLQPADPVAFHQYFQQNQQGHPNPSKGVYVKIGALEEHPVVYANGGFPEKEGQGQGDVHGAGKRN